MEGAKTPTCKGFNLCKQGSKFSGNFLTTLKSSPENIVSLTSERFGLTTTMVTVFGGSGNVDFASGNVPERDASRRDVPETLPDRNGAVLVRKGVSRTFSGALFHSPAVVWYPWCYTRPASPAGAFTLLGYEEKA